MSEKLRGSSTISFSQTEFGQDGISTTSFLTKDDAEGEGEGEGEEEGEGEGETESPKRVGGSGRDGS